MEIIFTKPLRSECGAVFMALRLTPEEVGKNFQETYKLVTSQYHATIENIFQEYLSTHKAVIADNRATVVQILCCNAQSHWLGSFQDREYHSIEISLFLYHGIYMIGRFILISRQLDRKSFNNFLMKRIENLPFPLLESREELLNTFST